MVLDPTTEIVLVYDIDVTKLDVLKKNIKKLNKAGFKKIYHIQSIKNFEDEIVFSSNIKNINIFFNTNSVDEFKELFINHKDIVNKLKTFSFDVNRIWSRENKKPPFNVYSNKKDLDFIRKTN